MIAYQRDDGADMVEYKPGRTIRRDHGIRLGLIAPELHLGAGQPAAFAPSADPQPDPIEPPPLQPSHEDLVLAAPEPATVTEVFEAYSRQVFTSIAASLDLTYAELTAPWPSGPVPAPRAPKSRPAKRPLSAILAASERGFRALRSKAKP